MELRDSNIENQTKGSNITYSTVDNEVAESLSSDMSDEVIIKTSGKPEKPKVVKCNDSDLVISWDVSTTDFEVVDFFEIQWKKKEEKRWSGRKNTDYNATTIKIPITDLEKNTAYQFKVRWTTQEGAESQFSDISDDVLIEMSQKPGKPKGVTSKGTDVLISWDVPPTDLQAVDFFELHWKKKEVKRWSGRKNTDDNCTTMKIPITEFEKNTAYQFKVRWTTKEGVESQFSDISDDIIIEMSQKPGKPKGVTSNDTELLINWDVPSSDLQAIDFFELHWKKKEEKRWSGRKTTNGNSTTMKIPIKDLEKYASYQFKVRWTTQEGVESQFSDISDDIIIEMSQKPGKPKGVTSKVGDLLISWDVPSSDLQAIDFFELHWKQKEEKRWSGRKNSDDNCTTIQIPMTEFEKNTAYQFKVRWTTQEGDESQFSDISDDIIIEMSQKPRKPKGVTSNDTELLISWDVPSSDLQAIDFFELHWKKKEEKRWSGRKTTNGNITTMKIPIKDLEKYASYQFKVRWTTLEGVESQFSDISDDIIIEMSQKPGKPKGVTSNVGDLLISWDVASLDLQAIDFFELHWKQKEEKRWSGRKNSDDNCTTIQIPMTEFEKNTAYQFKVRWTTKEGVESQFSDISDDIIIEMSQKPGKPKGVTSNVGDLLLSWDVPSSDLQVVDFFEIQWKKKDEKRWPGRRNTDDNLTSITIPITELEKNTVYQFKVRWVTKDGLESMFSEISEDIIIVMTKMPNKPNVVRRNDTELLICWHALASDLQGIDYFEIQWKRKEEKRWSGLKCTDDNSASIALPITEFERNNTYQFKVKWITKNGEESQFSEISDDILVAAPMSTRSPQQPGKVSSLQTRSNSVYLLWEKPEGPDEVSYYEVKYRSCGEVRWLCINTDQPVEKMHLKDLKSSNNYEFKVRAIFSDGNEGPFSEVSDMVTTQESLAHMLTIRATKVGCSNPQIYKLPLTFSGKPTNKTVTTRKARFGERDQLHSTKTIMVLGETGAGKSTLIDVMINYIVDVAWEDDFRFTITEDAKANTHLQTISGTNYITSYEVNYQHGSRLKYNLNIIDTPGFGDTRGIEHDKEIVDQIREFFMAPGDQGIDSIDAICFIIQAPLARLTDTRKYLFDAMLSVFGKNVKDNIFVLITFAECIEPPVLAALKEAKVPFQKAFKFNNCCLFEREDSSLPQMFWKLSMTGFDTFFAELDHVTNISLQQTAEVLALRQQIENTIERLTPQIREGLHALQSLKRETSISETFQIDILVNKNFTYTVKEYHQRRVDTKSGHYVIVCIRCNRTCLVNWRLADTKDLAKCDAFDSAGNCKVCPGNCHWTEHRSNNFIYEIYNVKQEKTDESLKAKYESAVDGEKQQRIEIHRIRSKLKLLAGNVLMMIKILRDNVNKLEQNALKPNPLNEVNKVELSIDREKREMKPGWENRLQTLKILKKKAELVQLVQKIPDAIVQDDWTEEDFTKFLETL